MSQPGIPPYNTTGCGSQPRLDRLNGVTRVGDAVPPSINQIQTYIDDIDLAPSGAVRSSAYSRRVVKPQVWRAQLLLP